MSILFYGDPHGGFKSLTEAAKKHKPDAVVLVGDNDCNRPLEQELETITDKTDIFWIPGNHDYDTDLWYNRLFESKLADKNIHGKVINCNGLRVAGLGGVFLARVWHPDPGVIKNVKWEKRSDYIESVVPKNNRDKPLSRKMQKAIWPEDYWHLADQNCDILITHEAPSSHRHGFDVIDDLAEHMGAKLIVHGHHHESYEGQTNYGCTVRGLAMREPWLFKGEL